MQQGTQQFIAQVVYAIPAMDELKRRFPTHVDPAYKGISFKPIKFCEHISRETRELEFAYVYRNRFESSLHKVLVEIDRRGLRPALPEELLAFDAKYPEELKRFPIVALGSETFTNGSPHVACLWDDDGRSLGLSKILAGWDGRCRFLAVPK